MCSGLLIASKTRSRGASKRRVSRISRSDGVLTLKLLLFPAPLTAMCVLLFLRECLQIRIEAIESLLPDGPIPLGPVGNVPNRARLETAWTPLRLAAARDQPRAFEHAQVLRYGRQADIERLRKLSHGPFARDEPGQNRAPGRIGQGRERGTE